MKKTSKTMSTFLLTGFMALAIMILAPQVSTASSFSGLGLVNGVSSYAYGVSQDGATVVGPGNSYSFRWTEDGGIENLGRLYKPSSTAYAVSADGSRVVGRTSTSYGNSAYLWTEATGMVSLGDLTGGSYSSQANDITPDGSVVVGYGSSADGTEAIIWTEETGFVGLGDLEGGSYSSSAQAVSADGSVVVGNGRSENGLEGFIWTEAAGMVGLGALDEENYWSQARDVSADGSTVVGYSKVGSERHSFIWTEETGMIDIGCLDGRAYTKTISGDGSVVGGYNNNGAIIWTEDLGMFYLYDFLVGLGVEGLDGWTLDEAWDISYDGLVIVGEGTNPDGKIEAWRVCLDEGTFSAVPVPGAIWLLGSGMIALAGFRRRSNRH
ncbi:MAG: VPLPA-CTERM sorting domain-containing protein [Desulfobacteraceae bacterium]